MVHLRPKKLILFGAACSPVTDQIAKAARHWNLGMLSMMFFLILLIKFHHLWFQFAILSVQIIILLSLYSAFKIPILIPVQLTYADTHPMFTEKSFPHFYRVVPSENEFNPPRLSILRYYNWTRVGTLYQNSAKYALVCTSIKCEYTQQARHSQIVQNALW